MKKLSGREAERYRKALGADFVEDFDLESTDGPLGWLALGEEVKRRLISRGGRPSMPEWDMKRPIPLRRANWDRLMTLGEQLGLSPAQFAALLIERALEVVERDATRKGAGSSVRDRRRRVA